MSKDSKSETKSDNKEMTEEEFNAELSRKLIQRPGTSRRIGILRLDYSFSVIVPLLMAIYFNNYSLWSYLDIIMGFLLYAIVGNTLNDVIDSRDPHDVETRIRIEGFHWKEIMVVAIVSFIFGSMFFIRTIADNPINGLILVIIIIMVVVYCLKKAIPIFNQILLGISHIFLPYIMIKIDANSNPVMELWEWLIMLTFFSYAYAGQIVHEIIDGDSITRYTPRTQQRIVIVSSIITTLIGAITLFMIKDIYLLPLILIPFGAIYTFRKPTKSTKGVKDVGIIMGNVILFYFLVLIIRQMTMF